MPSILQDSWNHTFIQGCKHCLCMSRELKAHLAYFLHHSEKKFFRLTFCFLYHEKDAYKNTLKTSKHLFFISVFLSSSLPTVDVLWSSQGDSLIECCALIQRTSNYRAKIKGKAQEYLVEHFFNRGISFILTTRIVIQLLCYFSF